MSNRGPIIFFLLGSVFLLALIVVLSFRGDAIQLGGSLLAAPFGPDAADAIEVVRLGEPVKRLKRTARNDWVIEAPFRAEADSVAVLRLLDALLLARPGDHLTAAELRRLGRRPHDFGFAPPKTTVTVFGALRKVVFELGNRSPSGLEVYLRLGGGETIYTVPVAAAAVPASLDGFRRRKLFHLNASEVVAADFRIPGAEFVKLARVDSAWQIVQPTRAVADAAVVNDVLTRLLALRAESFAWPNALSADVDVEPATGKIRKDRLVSYGLDAEDAFSVSFWNAAGEAERIVFGKAVGTNSVYALVHGGSTVVMVDAAAAEACRSGRASFLDARVFPFDVEDLTSVSVASGETVYMLARGTNGLWRIDSPVMAPADSAAVAELVTRVLRLRQNDLVSAERPSLSVTVRTKHLGEDGKDVASVSVPTAFLPSPANLRSKRILSFEPRTVRRLTVKKVGGAGGETSVARESAEGMWRLEKSWESASAISIQPSEEGTRRVLTALSRAVASSVENLNPARGDFVRHGLAPAVFTISADVASENALRHTLMLGNAAPGGGRYATAGGVDAIFIISREMAAELTIPLTESGLEIPMEKAKQK